MQNAADAADGMLRNISAADPDRTREHLPTDLGDMSVEIRDDPVVCRRFVPTGPVQGLAMSERTSTGEILGDTRRLRRARNVPEARRPFPRRQTGAWRHERSGRAKTSLREFPLRLRSPRCPPLEPPTKSYWSRAAGAASLPTTQRSRSSCGSRLAWLWWLCIIHVRVSPMIRRLESAS